MTELDLLSVRVRFSTAVSDLGVLVDSQLSMADHVASLSRTSLFQLRQLLVRSSLNEESACTPSSSAVSTTETACCMVSATSCCRSYRSFRTRPHEWWREQVSLTISPRCFANFTGCSSANALGSSWWWSSTSVSMGWRHRIWLTTVYWSLLWPADCIWDRRTPGSWSFGEHELLLAPETSRSPALSSGTLYL